jgi:crotonobetainyl-CoA:carnitine CoA-transferase CaiB-like acyl-CoA transferase
MPGPLHDIRVVEMTTAIQGPAAGLFFANMGAEVIKVEPPTGDTSRNYRGPNNGLPADAPVPAFVAFNKGKRSVTLDVHSELGNLVVQRLLANADVFISNYRALALTRMNLGLDELTAKYPKLVVGHVNGFGPRGADADKAMLDGAAQARGGLASMSGPSGGMPNPPGAALADTSGGLQLALACITALVARGSTGRGQIVRTSSLGMQIWLQQWELQHAAMTGNALTREANHHPMLKAPYGVYETSDGEYIMFIVAMTNEAWEAFWIFADQPERILDENWDSPAKRVGAPGTQEGLADIREAMAAVIRTRTVAEWVEFLYTQPEIIWERVRSHDDVLSDPQNIANAYITDLQLDGVGMTRTPGTLMEFSDTATEPVRQPPALGQHTREVLTALGFTEDDAIAVIDRTEELRQEALAAVDGGL